MFLLLLSDHLLAESYVGPEDSPEIHVGVQNKRRLSLISDGKFQPAFPEEAGEKLAGEGPKPRVYTISSERPMLSQQQSESMELVVIKGTEAEEEGEEEEGEVDGDRSLGQPLHNARSSHNLSRQCKASWPSHQQGSKEYPGCAQLTVSSQHPFDLEHHHHHHHHHQHQHHQHQHHHQTQAGETGWRRKKLERMYSMEPVSGRCNRVMSTSSWPSVAG